MGEQRAPTFYNIIQVVQETPGLRLEKLELLDVRVEKNGDILLREGWILCNNSRGRSKTRVECS